MHEGHDPSTVSTDAATARSVRVGAVFGPPSAPASLLVQHLLDLAPRGLTRGYDPVTGGFAHTVRRAAGTSGAGLRVEGHNLRYAAIAALGLAQLPESTQRDVLAGGTAADVAVTAAEAASSVPEHGAAALAAWATAELGAPVPARLTERLLAVSHGTPQLATVEAAWTLTALLASYRRTGADFDAVQRMAVRLMQAQHPSGLFPHVLPETAANRLRRHVGCFADQVYPIQALARFHAACGDPGAVEAANRCARRICALQGPAGQWWWHYDVRTGGVVEGYPVYSVHQHAMAPMALLELGEVGGLDLSASVRAGLLWISSHPEVEVSLVDDDAGMIWRSVRRREPRPTLRYLKAAATSLVPGQPLSWLDPLVPARTVDTECRPYELGWMLYAWLAAGVAAAPPTGLSQRGRSRPTVEEEQR